MKKIVIVIILIFGVVGLIAYQRTPSTEQTQQQALNTRTHNDQNPGPTSTSPTGAVIEITQSGSFPVAVIINVGSSITFKNVSDQATWPASDVHPAHDVYPEFDPKKPIPPEQSWNFTFNNAGTWGYHDHLNPVRRGKIIVLDKKTQAIKKEASETKAPQDAVMDTTCVDANSIDFTCYENYYITLSNQKGIGAAFDDLKTRYETNAYVQTQCHPLTHVIGRAATKLYPQVSEAYVHGDGFCWSGYYHGVMEGIVGNIGKKAIETQLNSICADVPGKERYAFDYYNCVHGLGHGLMAITNNELFDSLALCKTLKGNWEQTSCYGGVFMENVIIDNKNHFTKYLKPTEPLYPCTAVAQDYKHSCYLAQTSYMLKVTKNDYSKVFELCRQADDGYVSVCNQSLGRDASGQSLSNAEITKNRCDLGADFAERSNCLIGAVKDFVSYYHSDQQALHLCDIVSEDLKELCVSTTASYYTSF